jgi:hypothetical protein
VALLRRERPKYNRYTLLPSKPCSSHRCYPSVEEVVARRRAVAVAGSTVVVEVVDSNLVVEVVAGSNPVVGADCWRTYPCRYCRCRCRSSLGSVEEGLEEIGKTLLCGCCCCCCCVVVSAIAVQKKKAGAVAESRRQKNENEKKIGERVEHVHFRGRQAQTGVWVWEHSITLHGQQAAHSSTAQHILDGSVTAPQLREPVNPPFSYTAYNTIQRTQQQIQIQVK